MDAKRKFRETDQQMDRSISPESRSPSPVLSPRLLLSNQKDGKTEEVSSSNSKYERRDSVDKKKDSVKKSKGKSPKHRRSRSRSPARKHSRSRSPRRKRSRSPRRRRSRSRSKDRHRRSRSRSRDRRRSRSRDQHRSRSPRRRRFSRSPSPQFTSKWGMKRDITRAVLPEKGEEKKKALTTEEVEARVAQHMKSVQERAQEEAKNINLPGYLNPAMVNIHQFKQVQDKRKLLWSKTKDKKEGATQYAGGVGDEKFKRLMGIHDIDIETDESKVQQSRQVLNDLEREFEKSRAFQLSRGAGGITGIGLGFGSHPSQS